MPDKLKDIFFKEDFIQSLSTSLKSVIQDFDDVNFKKKIFVENWKSLELKEKMHHITETIHAFLPGDYVKSLEIIKKIAPSYSGFNFLIFPDFVEIYGINFPEISLPALEIFTKHCTSEFAIRPFLLNHQKITFDFIYKWAKDSDENVRRLASEGIRPRLPWGMNVPVLKSNPEIIIPVLEILKDDESETVRKSVANNLNDISKKHPDLVLNICESWYGKNEPLNKLIKHACRTLLKNSNIRAMKLFGFNSVNSVEVNDFNYLPKEIHIGEPVKISFNLLVKGADSQKIRMEYVLFYKTKSNIASKKVFQIKEGLFAPGTHNIMKNHFFIDNSIRKHVKGEHTLELIVNGEKKERIDFMLI